MAGIEDERASLEGYINTNWTSTPIKWEEVPYTPVADTPFIAVRIKPGGVGIVAMPNGNRYHGVLAIDIHCPKNEGTATIREYADKVIDMLMNKNIDGIIVGDATNYEDTQGDWLVWSILFSIRRGC